MEDWEDEIPINKEKREIINDFPAGAEELNPRFQKALSLKIEELEQTLHSEISELEQKLHNETKDTHYSEFSVYSGAAGFGLLYIHLAEVLKERRDEFLGKAVLFLDAALKNAQGQNVSFLKGDAGALAVAAVVFDKTNQQKESRIMITLLLQMHSQVISKRFKNNELLSGRAGYLYSLLFIKKHITSFEPFGGDVIKQVAEALILSGKKLAAIEHRDCPLMFRYNYFHQKPRVSGAARGIIGIINVLMEAHEFLTKDQLDNFIQPTIRYIMSIQSDRKSVRVVEDDRMNWFSGPSGYIMMMLKAFDIFGDETFLTKAKDSGEHLWKHGLTTYGYGLAHGISGNAYAFLALYQTTRDATYLNKARRFAEICFDCGKNGCSLPSNEFSLFGGIAGIIYFFSDLLDPKKALFPGFQLGDNQ